MGSRGTPKVDAHWWKCVRETTGTDGGPCKWFCTLKQTCMVEISLFFEHLLVHLGHLLQNLQHPVAHHFQPIHHFQCLLIHRGNLLQSSQHPDAQQFQWKAILVVATERRLQQLLFVFAVVILLP